MFMKFRKQADICREQLITSTQSKIKTYLFQSDLRMVSNLSITSLSFSHISLAALTAMHATAIDSSDSFHTAVYSNDGKHTNSPTLTVHGNKYPDTKPEK